MRKMLYLILTFTLLLTFTGCNHKKDDPNPLLGAWEAETELSILGVSTFSEESGHTVPAIYRFTFLADGTGTSNIVILQNDSDHIPDTSTNFTYTLSENTLEILYEGGNAQTFTVTFSGENLILDGRARIELTKTN